MDIRRTARYRRREPAAIRGIIPEEIQEVAPEAVRVKAPAAIPVKEAWRIKGMRERFTRKWKKEKTHRRPVCPCRKRNWKTCC